MDEYRPGEGLDGNEEFPYLSFNDFFIRRFKDGRRDFIRDEATMPAFSEGRYLAFEEVGKDLLFPVKGLHLSAKALLENEKWAKVFEGGPLMICRLCPVDYHRFHFPDGGRVTEHYRVKGRLHSVNPLALKYKSDIFCTNERQVSILETLNFGLLAYIEVGALCVGKIVQTYDEKRPFKRGDEKGYFLFGGSTVVLMGVKGAWRPSNDLIKNTSESVETYIKLGAAVAGRI